MLYHTIGVSNDNKVIDIACGNGCFLNRVKEKNPFYGYGVDI